VADGDEVMPRVANAAVVAVLLVELDDRAVQLVAPLRRK
jgi:hypothetical protein